MVSDNKFDIDYVSIERTNMDSPIISFDLNDKMSGVATDDAEVKD